MFFISVRFIIKILIALRQYAVDAHSTPSGANFSNIAVNIVQCTYITHDWRIVNASTEIDFDQRRSVTNHYYIFMRGISTKYIIQCVDI